MNVSIPTVIKIAVCAAIIGALILFIIQQRRGCSGDGSFDSVMRAIFSAAGVSCSDLSRVLGGENGRVRIVKANCAAETRRLAARSSESGHSVANECLAAEMDDDVIEIRRLVDKPQTKQIDDSDYDEPLPHSGVRVERCSDASFESECQTIFEELVVRHGGLRESVKHSVVIYGPSLPPRGILVSSLYDDNRILFGVCPLPHHMCEFPNARHTSLSAFELDRNERALIVKAALTDGVVIADVPFSIHGGCSTAHSNRRLDLERFLGLVIAKHCQTKI